MSNYKLYKIKVGPAKLYIKFALLFKFILISDKP